MSHRMTPINAEQSLHDVKDVPQLSFMEEQTRSILPFLDCLIENTRREAPVRQSGHPYSLQREFECRDLSRGERNKEQWMEKHWEEACRLQWRDSVAGMGSDLPFYRIVSYQVMLRESNANKKWGEIDLIGENDMHMPVVIELKSKPSEYLLLAILEVVAYGIAIQKAWATPESQFMHDWTKTVGMKDPPSVLSDCPLVVAAPTEYWDICLSGKTKRVGFQTSQTAREAILELLHALEQRDYSVTLVEICHGGKDQIYPPKGLRLPTLTGARILSINSGR
jgi:hypothetical protein